MANLYANWPAPANVNALTTTRLDGFSQAPYDSNNLGLHVGDNITHVEANRRALINKFKLMNAPQWLEQTHSTHCVVIEEEITRQADAAITRQPNQALAIMTADCLPIVICNNEGKEIAAIHAGWRGLVNGIIENTLNKMQSMPNSLMAWIGPSICQSCFEVGDEVYAAFQQHYPFTTCAFQSQQEKWLANLPYIAELILQHQLIGAVYQAKTCTFEQKNRFYSYRRETQTGRMATLIWFN